MIKYTLIGALVLITTLSHSQTYKVEEIQYEFEVKEIAGINSKYNDFSPVVYGDQLIITSGRESNFVLQGENNWKKTGFLNIFASNFKGELSSETKFGTPVLFSEDIANNNHSGPLCFSTSGDTVFFTQLDKIEKRVKKARKPQLFMAIRDGNKWTNIEKLPFCQEDFSFGHPAYDSKNRELYFVSTMEGGKGGKDLYKVVLGTDGWGTPENLTEFNTEYDEMFPFIIGRDLFFSSDRPGGVGELDIYWKVLGHEQELLPVAFNTGFDDHGIFMLPGNEKGFVSIQTEGVDNVFFLDITRSVIVTNELAGQFTYRNLDNTYASGLDIQLIHEDEIVFQSTSDSLGKFAFRNLPFENYTIRLLNEEDVELVLFDKNGKPVTYLLQDGDGKFQYKKIGYESAGTLSLLEEMNKTMWLDFTDITGQFVFENIPGQYGDSLKVMLVDEDGNIIFEDYTDKRGNFTFVNIPTDQNYTITTEEVNEDLFLFIYDQNGNVFTQLKSNENGEWLYRKIDPDYANNLQYLAVNDDVFELETMSITGNFNYKKLEGEFNEGLTVYLFTEDGFLLDSTKTDAQGHFMFSSLNPDEAYIFKINENDPNFVMEEFNLHVEDRFGKVLADLYRADDGFFRYRELESETADNLTKIQGGNDNFELDPTQTNNNQDNNGSDTTPEITVKLPPVGDFSIYFDLNSSYTNLKGNDQLNQLINDLKSNSNQIKIHAFADCRSTDKYNMWLSERRGFRVKEYMIKKGIPESRISIVAFGESQLVNDCSNGVSCPDEEHAKNRRVDLQIVK